jgi:hypothetical protein
MKKPPESVTAVIITEPPIAGIAPEASAQHRNRARRRRRPAAGSASSPPVITSAEAHAAVEPPGDQAEQPAPEQAVDQRDADFLASAGAPHRAATWPMAMARTIMVMVWLPELPPMPATMGISAASATSFLDRALEGADHARGDEGGDQVDRQPGPAVLHRIHTEAKMSSSSRRPACASCSSRLLADVVHHRSP